MTPAQARELFSEAYEQELDPAQAQAFAAALAGDPDLESEFEAFVATQQLARGAATARVPSRAPNLLPGVQRRLRARSRGRFYADRFAERLGTGLLQPLAIAFVLLGLLALAWFAHSALGLITVGGH